MKTPIPTKFVDNDGNNLTNRQDMEKHVQHFYISLFESKIETESPILLDEDIPEFLPTEILNAIKNSSSGKAPGMDNIETQDLKYCVESIAKPLTQRFNWYLRERNTPSAWKSSKTTLVFKKGKLEDIKNYRPICLLSNIYKLFTTLILQRIKRNLNTEVRKVQAGSRSNFSTIDHIHTLRKVIEKHNEYNLPFFILFIDFEKAFYISSTKSTGCTTQLHQSHQRDEHEHENKNSPL